ncbi:hypothetical protein N7481_002404 [Penicillium waksmanii]|uniref:uncharacterized protein n=1 Tax=Penicillium waksmanii TaxID=69791 RepID=UPI0025469754|nr:uncharacterized protein N7481_002404 [Penicillium waksmanii]KAJ5995427.1 hypothetical protein N7481_002404 [Penicillium waksmanii]
MKLTFPFTLYSFLGTVLASPSVKIEAGTLQGAKCGDGKDAVYYKGIPFAEPPIGNLRFEPPKTYTKSYSNGILNATTNAPTCVQFGDDMVPSGKKSEDCLYLNVWTPATATKDSKLPVKVWVYGGSDTSGGIGYPLYDGCNMANDGSILVSINYRLGPLGFMALNTAGIYGNQGIQDVLLGLEWVQKSIASFGGDPKKVLLFGQSAGATDVFTIATLSQAPSLFKSVIAESIALPSLVSNLTLQKTSASVAQVLKCDLNDKSCLQSKSIEDIQSAVTSDPYMYKGLGTLNGTSVPNGKTPKFWPYVDGTIIKENPLNRGAQVPAIIGYNQQEGMMDTLTKYNSAAAVKALNATDYKTFLQGNFGSASRIIEKYYPLSAFIAAAGSTEFGVLEAIATVLTDSEFKFAGYQSARSSARNNVPVWVYEFTHNSTCAWLPTMPSAFLKYFGAAHTAEIPYVFGNLDFDFPANNSTCNGTNAEWDLSKKMTSLWTAMAENAKPAIEGVKWPEFQITRNGSQTPGMIFDNSTSSGYIDFQVCQLWDQIGDTINLSNATSSGTPPQQQ